MGCRRTAGQTDPPTIGNGGLSVEKPAFAGCLAAEPTKVGFPCDSPGFLTLGLEFVQKPLGAYIEH